MFLFSFLLFLEYILLSSKFLPLLKIELKIYPKAKEERKLKIGA